MKAAYKWRIQNGLYAYLTDENNNGLFVYDLQTGEREYEDGTIVSGSSVNDGAIATIVSKLSKQQYTILFNQFKTFIEREYPDVQLLDVTYYYNIESDECSASASSLKCSATDIIFDATAVTGTPVNAVVTNEQTDPNTGEELRYRIDFTIPPGEQGPVGPTPNLQVGEVETTTLDPTENANVTVTRQPGSTDLNPKFDFEFEIPRGKGVDPSNNIIVNNLTSSTINTTTINTTNLTATTANVTNLTATTINTTNLTATTANVTNLTATTVNTTNLTATTANVTNLTASTITTNKIETKEIKDKVFSGTANSIGWWTIYKVPRESSSVRMHIAETCSCEEFYIEVNTGWWDSDALGNIAILNGYIPLGTRINGVRIVDDVNGDNTNRLADIQIYVSDLCDNSPLYLRFNNIEGSGEFVFEKDNHTGLPGHNYTILHLSDGIKAEKFVKNGGTSSQYLMADGSVSTGQTDTKVYQKVTTSSNSSYRPLILGESWTDDNPPTSSSFSDKTDKVYASHNMYVKPSTGDLYVNNITATSINTTSITINNQSVTDMMPTGSIIMWAGDTAPSGWLLCNGDQISFSFSQAGASSNEQDLQGKHFVKNQLNALALIMAAKYGTYGTLPDLRAKFPLGAYEGRGVGFQENDIGELVITPSATAAMKSVTLIGTEINTSNSILLFSGVPSNRKKSGTGDYYKVISYTEAQIPNTYSEIRSSGTTTSAAARRCRPTS